MAIGAVAPETGGMPKHANQQAIDAPTPPGGGSVMRKRATGKAQKRARCWTDKDEAFIELHSGSMTDAEMAAALGRSIEAIRHRRLGILGLRKAPARENWSAESRAMLEALYGEVDTSFLAAMLCCSVPRMRQYAWRMGLQAAGFWSREEDEILRNHLPHTPIAQFAELFPGRSLQAIYGRAHTLALSREPSYMLRSPKRRWSCAYPPELKSLISLLHQVERKLHHVQAQHRKHEGPPIQGA